MSTGVYLWSTTAASNGNSDPSINFQEGQAPSSVNDSARALMAAVAKWRDDNNGSLTTGGTSTAYTLTSNQATAGTIPNGFTIGFKAHAANGATPTLSVDGSTARELRVFSGTSLPAGVLSANSVYVATYISATTEWLIRDISAAAAITATTDLIVTIGDGMNTIPTGVGANWFEVDFAGTIAQWSVLANQSGSVSIDVWKTTHSSFDAGGTHPVAGDKISASAPITFSSTTKGQDSTLSGWTKTFSAGDILAFNVASVTTCKQVTISMKVTRTS